MPRGKSGLDSATLEMALVGYELERYKVEGKIRELQAQLRGKKLSAATGESKPVRVKRVLSAAARARIAAAQRKRWAEHHKRMAAAAD